MPYIDGKKTEKDKPNQRRIFDADIDILSSKIETDGQLNYVFTRLALGFIKKQGRKYTVLNTVVGVFECAKNELYRRLAGKYEDLKIKQAGDVQDYEDLTKDL